MRHHGIDDETASNPHAGHDWTEEESESLPFFLQIATGKLNACKNELYAEDQTAEIQSYCIEVFLRASVFKRFDKVRSMRRECDAGEERDHFLFIVSKCKIKMDHNCHSMSSPAINKQKGPISI